MTSPLPEADGSDVPQWKREIIEKHPAHKKHRSTLRASGHVLTDDDDDDNNGQGNDVNGEQARSRVCVDVNPPLAPPTADVDSITNQNDANSTSTDVLAWVKYVIATPSDNEDDSASDSHLPTQKPQHHHTHDHDGALAVHEAETHQALTAIEGKLSTELMRVDTDLGTCRSQLATLVDELSSHRQQTTDETTATTAKLSALATDHKTLTDSHGTLANEHRELTTRHSSLETRVDALERRVEEIAGRVDSVRQDSEHATNALRVELNAEMEKRFTSVAAEWAKQSDERLQRMQEAHTREVEALRAQTNDRIAAVEAQISKLIADAISAFRVETAAATQDHLASVATRGELESMRKEMEDKVATNTAAAVTAMQGGTQASEKGVQELRSELESVRAILVAVQAQQQLTDHGQQTLLLESQKKHKEAFEKLVQATHQQQQQQQQLEAESARKIRATEEQLKRVQTELTRALGLESRVAEMHQQLSQQQHLISQQQAQLKGYHHDQEQLAVQQKHILLQQQQQSEGQTHFMQEQQKLQEQIAHHQEQLQMQETLMQQYNAAVTAGPDNDKAEYRDSESDSQLFLATCGSDGSVRIWDGLTAKLLMSLSGHTEQATSVAFSSCGKYLVSGAGDKKVIVWSLSGLGAIEAVLEGHTRAVYTVTCSPDAKFVASTSRDRTVRLWSLETKQLVRIYKGHEKAVHGAAFSACGTRLATGSADSTVRIWDVETGQVVCTLKGHEKQVYNVAWKPQSVSVVASTSEDGTVILWDTDAEQPIRTFKGHELDVVGCKFNSLGTQMLSCSEDKTVRVWDVLSGKLVCVLSGHTEDVIACSFSPDTDDTAVSASLDGTVRVWDVKTKRQVLSFEGHDGNAVWACVFAPALARRSVIGMVRHMQQHCSQKT